MTGRVSIVTGAEAGVGFEVAKSLCEAGNEVILACKDEAQTSAAVGKIKEHVPDALAAFMQVGCVVCVCVCVCVCVFLQSLSRSAPPIGFPGHCARYKLDYYYLRQGSYVFVVVCSVCLSDLSACLRRNFRTDLH